MIEICELTKFFVSKSLKKITAVDGISISFENGIYGLLGPNGSGKTTVLRSIMGLYNYKGNISIDSKDIKKNPEMLKRIGYLPQQFDMFKELNLFDMMSYFAELKGIDKKSRTDAILEALQTVNLEDKMDCKVKSLSGGMKRRSGIAQALLGNPDYIILDEPTVGLDVEERLRFKNIINNISEDKIIILSTHIIEDVEALCRNIVIMNSGRIIADTQRDLIAKKAEDKVYEFEYDDMPFSCEIVKIYERDNKKYVRVLSRERLNCKSLEPTAEDGYLCYIKGI